MRKLFRSIYQVLPFKLPFLRIIRLFKPGHQITRHLVFTGKVKVKVDEGGAFYIQNYGDGIEQGLFWHGIRGWEKHSTHIWMQLARKSKVIFDIGANSGAYTLLAKTVQPTAELYTFEPVKRIFQRLEENVRINQFQGVHLFHKAVSNQTGTASIQTSVTGNLYEASLNADHISNMTHLKKDLQFVHEEIETITLRDLIEKENIRQIDLMKIDVESHEPEVIEGMENWLATFSPIMLIEVLNQTVAEKLTPYFPASEYLFYNISEEAGLTEESNLMPSKTYNFLICPRHKKHLLDGCLPPLAAK
ncbi:FkbM family methyltransferase [Paraflavitalea pollutisoli]|uniref:FkbM family methyltransferase n=1 Tax=Paraflavitalea pollutisoli TaxID=3034143 RepID=UPI0023EAE5BA|nr:FkbM family methyltransferase [Paraflavitalea sp. H1-2-19X]